MRGLVKVVMIVMVVITMAKSEEMGECTDARITYYDYSSGQCSFGAIGGPTLLYDKVVAPNDAFFGTDGSKCGGTINFFFIQKYIYIFFYKLIVCDSVL